MRKFSLQFFLLLVLFAGAFFLASSLLSRAGGGVRVNHDENPPARYSIQVVLKARANPPDSCRFVEMGTNMAVR